ncbi:hypothetical protein, partial [Roseisolibacter agri]|uniref:hypothetical protein n=1 Tax=Roseisolibacter agri TaxID=2014610 RepID=UPI0024E0D09A
MTKRLISARGSMRSAEPPGHPVIGSVESLIAVERKLRRWSVETAGVQHARDDEVGGGVGD